MNADKELAYDPRLSAFICGFLLRTYAGVVPGIHRELFDKPHRFGDISGDGET